MLEPPLWAWQPRSTIPGYPYPRRSGISTVSLPSVHPGYVPLRGMQDPPQQRFQPQNTMPGDLNLQGSAVTYTQGIPRFPTRGMQGARHHEYNPYFICSGVPTHTLSTVNLESFLPHQTQYGFHPQSASQSFPQPQFSGPVTCSVTHSPVIPGNCTRAPLQAQPQSASPVDLYQVQGASSGGPYLSGPTTPPVTHSPVIPGFFPPSGMQRGSSEVQHERNPSTESDTRPSQ